METANQLLAEIQKVKATRTAAAGRQTQRPTRIPASSSEQISTPQSPPYTAMGQDSVRPSMEGLRSSIDNMQIRPVEAAPPSDYGGPMPPAQQQLPSPAGPAYPYGRGEPPSTAARIPPGARVPEPPMPFVDQQQARFKPPEPDGYPPGAGYVQVCSLSLLLVIQTMKELSNFSRRHTKTSSNHLTLNPILPNPSLVSPVYLNKSNKHRPSGSRQFLLANSSCSNTRQDLRDARGKLGSMISISWLFLGRGTSAKLC